MKTSALAIGLGLFVFCLSACVKTEHTLRFRNGFNETIYYVKVGSASLGDVTAGQTSDYNKINTGDFVISGTTTTGRTLSGSGTISGKGRHKWTVTMSADGQIAMAED